MNRIRRFPNRLQAPCCHWPAQLPARAPLPNHRHRLLCRRNRRPPFFPVGRQARSVRCSRGGTSYPWTAAGVGARGYAPPLVTRRPRTPRYPPAAGYAPPSWLSTVLAIPHLGYPPPGYPPPGYGYPPGYVPQPIAPPEPPARDSAFRGIRRLRARRALRRARAGAVTLGFD